MEMGVTKRRLPNWMVGSAIDKIDDSERAKQSKKPLQVEEGSVLSVEDGNVLDSGGFHEMRLKKCATRGRRKLSKEPLHKEKSVNHRPKGGKDMNREENEVSEIPIDSDDEDVDLTMEDLMSIAEEYVKADEAGVQDVLNKNSIPESESMNGLEVSYSDRASSNIDESVVNVCETSDSTRDMLDLFLGPLLKKPLEKKTREAEFDLKEMVFMGELRKQNEDNIVGEEIDHLVKKKSSLKDKVAMLLD